MEKEYQDIESMFKDAYQHVSKTGIHVKLDIIKKDDNCKYWKYIVVLSSNDILYCHPFKNGLTEPFMKLMKECRDHNITFDQLINKQLLPFL